MGCCGVGWGLTGAQDEAESLLAVERQEAPDRGDNIYPLPTGDADLKPNRGH